MVCFDSISRSIPFTDGLLHCETVLLLVLVLCAC
jgi:hypothetical protein